MRAKAKPFDPTFWPVPDPVIWCEKDRILLTQDLDLDTITGQTMLDALSKSIESYHAGVAFNKERPSLASQLAELKGLSPKIERAYLGLRDLSPLARGKIRHAYVDGMGQRKITAADVTQASQIDRAVDCAHQDLLDLTLAIQQAVKNLSLERRGRKPAPVHVLIKALAVLFTDYDRGEHDDERARRSACDAFVRHALRASKIPAPARLSQLLSQQ